MPTSGPANQKIIFSKILVAIDGSKSINRCSRYAVSMSKEYNAELYALHVICADVDLFGLHPNSEYTPTMKNECEKYLDKVKLKADEKNIQISPFNLVVFN